MSNCRRSFLALLAVLVLAAVAPGASAQCPWPASGSETFSAVIPGGTFAVGAALSVHNFSLFPIKYVLSVGQFGIQTATNCGGLKYLRQDSGICLTGVNNTLQPGEVDDFTFNIPAVTNPTHVTLVTASGSGQPSITLVAFPQDSAAVVENITIPMHRLSCP